MKKVFRIESIIISVLLFINLSTLNSMIDTNAHALCQEKQINVSSESYNQVLSSLENFFNNYEKEVDSEYLDSSFIQDAFVIEKNHKTKISIELIKTHLLQIIYSKTHHLGGIAVKEQNKKVTYEYLSVQIEKESAIVDVCVTKTFNYNVCPDVESASMDRYLVELEREKNSWKISCIDGFISDECAQAIKKQGYNLDDEESIRKYRRTIMRKIDEYNICHMKEKTIQQETKTSTTYNASGAYTYATTYVFSPNSNYFNLESTCGDCTNFASQVLHEGGGIPEHFGSNGYNNCWFYTSSSNRSTSWAGANYLYDYMHSTNSKIAFYTSNWSSVVSGDLIQVDYTGSGYVGHSMIVTGVVYSSYGRSDLLVTYRSVTGSHKKNYLISLRTNDTIRHYMHISGGI